MLAVVCIAARMRRNHLSVFITLGRGTLLTGNDTMPISMAWRSEVETCTGMGITRIPPGWKLMLQGSRGGGKICRRDSPPAGKEKSVRNSRGSVAVTYLNLLVHRHKCS